MDTTQLEIPAAPTFDAQPAQQECPTFVTYDNFTEDRFVCTPPETMKIPGDKGQYFQMNAMYNMGVDGQAAFNDCYVEGPEMTSEVGIRQKEQNDRMQYSLMVRLNSSSIEQMRFAETMKRIARAVALNIGKYKGPLQAFNFNPDAPGDAFREPIMFPRDSMTGELIQGRSPIVFFNLFKRGKAPFEEKTLFTEPNGTPIEWHLLQNTEVKFIPLFHVRSVTYLNKVFRIKIELVNAIVTGAHARGSQVRNLSTLARLQSQTGVCDTVSGMVAKLIRDRQDTHPGAPPMGSQSTEEPAEDQATNAGLERPQAATSTGSYQAPSGAYSAPPSVQMPMMTGVPQVPGGIAVQGTSPQIGGIQPATMASFTQGMPAQTQYSQPMQQYQATGIPSVPGLGMDTLQLS